MLFTPIAGNTLNPPELVILPTLLGVLEAKNVEHCVGLEIFRFDPIEEADAVFSILFVLHFPTILLMDPPLFRLWLSDRPMIRLPFSSFL